MIDKNIISVFTKKLGTVWEKLRENLKKFWVFRIKFGKII